MDPGKLKHRISFQKFIETRDKDGFKTQEWVEVRKAWAMIKTMKGREFYQAASTQAERTVRFIIRYTPDIDSNMRIEYKGRFFEIVEPPINDDELNKTLTVLAKEMVNNGD
ncbi:phage head closure protein [Pseudobacillus badius]|uniref:phage head closure protein n=1 Tax=Bacillus badius TaxID=1455 RepID=UPI0007B3C488|nr:phage head closure protein [Bacillus badius]KZR60390.1 head-tail adaptor protein [Bacillus badius]